LNCSALTSHRNLLLLLDNFFRFPSGVRVPPLENRCPIRNLSKLYGVVFKLPHYRLTVTQLFKTRANKLTTVCNTWWTPNGIRDTPLSYMCGEKHGGVWCKLKRYGGICKGMDCKLKRYGGMYLQRYGL
jgi:hypothetical protein